MIRGQNSEYIFKVQALTATFIIITCHYTAPFGETNIQMFNAIPSRIKMLYRIISEFCEMIEEGPNLIWGNH